MADVELDEDWVKENKITVERNSLIAIYTTDFFPVINSGLRGGLYTALAKTIADHIVEAIEENPPYPEKICLYRGRNNPYVYENLQIGDEVAFDGFTSMSTEIEIAERYTGPSKINSKFRRAPIIVLCFPKNSKFVYAVPISQSWSEDEMIAFPNFTAIYVGKTEVNPEFGSYEYTFHVKDYRDTSELEGNSDFDYRFLFYLSKVREIVNRTEFLRSVSIWETLLYPEIYEKYEILIELTDLWGYSEDFIKEIDELMTEYDIEERDMVHIFQFYISYLLHLNDPDIEIETGPIKLYQDHTNFLSLDYEKDIMKKSYFEREYKEYYRGDDYYITKDQLISLLRGPESDLVEIVRSKNLNDDLKRKIIENQRGNLIPTNQYNLDLAILEMFYRISDYTRLSQVFTSDELKLIHNLKLSKYNNY